MARLVNIGEMVLVPETVERVRGFGTQMEWQVECDRRIQRTASQSAEVWRYTSDITLYDTGVSGAPLMPVVRFSNDLETGLEFERHVGYELETGFGLRLDLAEAADPESQVLPEAFLQAVYRTLCGVSGRFHEPMKKALVEIKVSFAFDMEVKPVRPGCFHIIMQRPDMVMDPAGYSDALVQKLNVRMAQWTKRQAAQ